MTLARQGSTHAWLYLAYKYVQGAPAAGLKVLGTSAAALLHNLHAGFAAHHG